MSIGFVNLAMLAGLAAVLIPPLIHLLNRRRYDVVAWGAMQFLQVSQTTRRRFFLEELLLMGLRMGLIALLVLGLAAPYAAGVRLGALGDRPGRDVVLVLDGTSSMTVTDEDNKSPFEAARERSLAYLEELAPGDRVALLVARQPPELVLGELGQDFDLVRERIADLPSPRGIPDWPRTLEIAHQMLKEQGKNPRREIVLFTDDQRHGWADPRTLSQWERLAPQWSLAESGTAARTRVVAEHVVHASLRGLANYSLTPIKTSRTLAWLGQRLTFRGALHGSGLKVFAPPQRLYWAVDGQPMEEISLPAKPTPNSGQMSFTFTQQFTTPGPHLVSVIMEPDLAAPKRPPGYQVRDCLPADNRQDLVVEVIRALPVLLVDGDMRLSPESSTFFLERALAGPSDSKQPAAVAARAVPAADFRPELLESANRPRVVILADVPRLSQTQADALEKFAAEGGGILVVLGRRLAADARVYNELLYRDGQGWLPARLEKVEGDAARPESGVHLDVKRFQHPALELFQDESQGSLSQARFPRWWKVATSNSTRATVAGLLTSSDPFLAEQAHGKGRVMLCTVPLDRAWGGNFPSLWEYPVLIHELVYYLAGARSEAWNLQPGQPLRLSHQALDAGSAPDRLLLTPPEGKSRSLKVAAWPWSFDNTGAVGPYQVHAAPGSAAYFVVHGDPRESDLTPCTEEDRQKVARWLPVQYGDKRASDERPQGEDLREDLWWLFLTGVIALLCGEIWWTRRLALRRGV